MYIFITMRCIFLHVLHIHACFTSSFMLNMLVHVIRIHAKFTNSCMFYIFTNVLTMCMFHVFIHILSIHKSFEFSCWYRLKEDYLTAVDGIRKHLLRYTTKSGLAFVGSYSTWESKTFHSDMASPFLRLLFDWSCLINWLIGWLG